MSDSDHDLARAARDTLMVIAGASGTAAKDLRPGQSLTADLGLDDAGLALLAGYMHRIAERLGRHPINGALDPERLRDVMVGQAFASMLAHAGLRPLPEDAIFGLLIEAQAILRGGGLED